MRYRCDKFVQKSDGSVIWYAHWMGTNVAIAKVDKCRWTTVSGEHRVTATALGEPDTYFSIPAEIRFKGCRVRGYLTGAEEGEGILVFRHTYA